MGFGREDEDEADDKLPATQAQAATLMASNANLYAVAGIDTVPAMNGSSTMSAMSSLSAISAMDVNIHEQDNMQDISVDTTVDGAYALASAPLAVPSSSPAPTANMYSRFVSQHFLIWTFDRQICVVLICAAF